ncbi:hypothetical protein [Staphylococcus equorum]|uniref:hypothetical protein n=1 Tax=Staphylococcus equorum TaxID=246432 RepID=UPI00192D15D9|nr:hypothetical protein [Staphylococcus equorum]
MRPEDLVGTIREYQLDYWSSDWNGDELGMDEILVTGLYTVKENPEISYYIDTETGIILDAWVEDF